MSTHLDIALDETQHHEAAQIAHVQAHTLLVLTYHHSYLLEIITSVTQHPMVPFSMCSIQTILFSWNGYGCGRESTCCPFNQPPWLMNSKELQYSTTNDLELRIGID